MAHDTTDSPGYAKNSTGDLFDWQSGTPSVDKTTPVWSLADGEYKTVAPVAAIPDAGAAPTQAQFNLVLAALRTKGIILP